MALLAVQLLAVTVHTTAARQIADGVVHGSVGARSLSPSFPINELRALVRGPVLACDSSDHAERAAYNQSIYIDNGLFQTRPTVVVQGLDDTDVVATIRFARQYGAHLTVKGGGHSAVGYALNPDIVLDMVHFNRTVIVSVDPSQSSAVAVIEAGLRWIDAYSQLAPWVPVGGTCHLVGVMGFTLGGGYSILSRSYGLGIDQIIAFDLVTAAGELLTVSQDSQPDLFWALRGGGGGNFGVVTRMHTRVHATRTPLIYSALLCWSVEFAADAMRAYSHWLVGLPNEMAAYGMLFQLPQTKEDQLCLTIVYNGDSNKGAQIVAPLLQLAGVQVVSSKEETFQDFILSLNGITDVRHRNAILKSGMLQRRDDNTPYFPDTLIGHMMDFFTRRPSNDSMLIWTHAGGAIGDVSPEDTAFFRRGADFVFEIKAIYDDPRPAVHHANEQWIEDLHTAITPFLDGSYVNYIDPNLSDWRSAYYGTNYDRLVEIKQTYDETNFWHFAQSVGNELSLDSSLSVPDSDSMATVDIAVHVSRLPSVLDQVMAFQFGQCNLSVPMLADLFSDSSVINIPIGTGGSSTTGKDQILASFGSYFVTLVSLAESITSPIVVNGLYAAFAKTNVATMKERHCVVTYDVVNWFRFDAQMIIQEYSALFNLSDVQRQKDECGLAVTSPLVDEPTHEFESSL